MSLFWLNAYSFPQAITMLLNPSSSLQPREKGRMRFHKLQNVQIALDFLRHRQVRHTWGSMLVRSRDAVVRKIIPLPFVFSGQAGQHQKRWHSRWEPQAHAGVNMDHHPSLPGLLLCQCFVPLFYRSVPPPVGSAVSWDQSEWILLSKFSL